MKKLSGLILLAMFNLPLLAQQMVPVWVNSVGGPGWDMANAIAVTPKDEVVIAGTFSDSIKIGQKTYFSKGFSDVFTAKYSGSGELIGAFIFGGAKYDFAQLAAYDDYLILVTKFYSGFDLQGKKIDSTGVVNYLVGWFDDKGALMHKQTLSSKGDLNVSSIETDHKGTVFLTGWYSQNLMVGGDQTASQKGENAFVVAFKKNGKEKSVQKLSKRKSSRYYSSTIGKDKNLYVAGITSDGIDSTNEMSLGSLNQLVLTSFEKGEKRDSGQVLLTGIDLIPVSVKEAGDKLWIAAQFKYYCVNGKDTLFAQGQNDVVMMTVSEKTNEKTVWTVGGRADDLPLNLSVSGKQVILTGSYSDVFTAGSSKLKSKELGSDLFLVSYEAETQKQLKALSIGGVNNDFPCAAITSQAGVYILGQFRETLESGNNQLKTNGSYDVFVGRYENCGAKKTITIASKVQKNKKGETTYQLTAADGYTSYRWDNNLGFSPNVEAKAGNTYLLEAVDQTGCICYGQINLNKTKSATIPQDEEIPDENGQVAEFKLYPTITDGIVYWQPGSNFPADGANLKVFNASGQQVLEQNYAGDIGATVVQDIDLGKQVPGIYLIEISGTGYSKDEKVRVK